MGSLFSKVTGLLKPLKTSENLWFYGVFRGYRRPATFWKRDSTGVFLRNLWKRLFYRTPRNDCFWKKLLMKKDIVIKITLMLSMLFSKKPLFLISFCFTNDCWISTGYLLLQRRMSIIFYWKLDIWKKKWKNL